VLVHLSEKNNHPEVARMSAETALRECGRTDVRLEVAGRSGTDWLDVSPPEEPPQESSQLPLF
jgi:hypothetical protein